MNRRRNKQLKFKRLVLLSVLVLLLGMPAVSAANMATDDLQQDKEPRNLDCELSEAYYCCMQPREEVPVVLVPVLVRTPVFKQLKRSLCYTVSCQRVFCCRSAVGLVFDAKRLSDDYYTLLQGYLRI